MPIRHIAVAGYRSLRDVKVYLSGVTVVAGANGSGKTNLYRALQLAHSCGTGGLARRIVSEGGMQSVTWAGDRRGEQKIDLEIALDDYVYEIRMATASRSAPRATIPFPLDPVVVSERIWFHTAEVPNVEMLERVGATAFLRDAEGKRVTFAAQFRESETVLTQINEPRSFPEVIDVRGQLASMRFHHQLRTDDLAPARQANLGTRTFAVADDGCDLAAALRTIEIEGDWRALAASVADAFDGAELDIAEDEAGRLELQLSVGNLHRPLRAAELSDGQLRFLFLAAALMAPRPASVVVLNEPESSLHPRLLRPLADLVNVASENVQIVVTTHSDELIERLGDSGARLVRLEMVGGATDVVG